MKDSKESKECRNAEPGTECFNHVLHGRNQSSEMFPEAVCHEPWDLPAPQMVPVELLLINFLYLIANYASK